MDELSCGGTESAEIGLRPESGSRTIDADLEGGAPARQEEFACEDVRVLSFEPADEQPAILVRSLFPAEYVFPPLAALTPEEISDKVDEIATVFAAHNISFAFDNNLPDDVLYKYLVEDYIPNEVVSTVSEDNFRWFNDDCDGGCAACFQKEHCSTAGDVLQEQDLDISAEAGE
jgi:hypothetical protein